MEKCFSFGKYSVSIEGKQELLDCFQPRWGLLSKELCECPDALIHIREGLDAKADCFSESWRTHKKDDLTETVFYQNGEPLFSLHNSSPYEVTVKINSISENHLFAGIHYGLMLALHHSCVSLHGVTLLCLREVIILSAPSGTGKTTLGKLLEKYCEGIIINGDFALLTPTEGGVFFEPTPFCGTSGRRLNHRFLVNRVVFLEQSKENIWHSVSGREAMKRFMSNSFVPTWDTSIQQTIQENILKCISTLKVNTYEFAPTQEAAETFIRNLSQ